MLTKNATIQIKAGPEDGLSEGQFVAYASVFGNVDSYGDVVVKGAFANDLARWEKSGNTIPLLFGHNMADPDFNIGSVVSAEEDNVGLKVTAQLDLENPKAKQVYRMLKGKRIDQMSFAYDVLDGGPATKDGEDVYVRSSALPEGVEDLKAGQKVEFGLASGRRGPQALSVKLIDPPPSLTRTRREAAAAEHKHTPDELHGTVEDMITLLEGAVQPELRKGRYPDRKIARRVSEVVQAVARELDA